ncbi:MAG: hypothetical protein JJ916_11880 [Phycisphaerales bacterium]|nr:hypothetical protein [Phycisphaerales bacterium]
MTHTQLTTELVHDLVVEPIPTLDICAKHELNLTQLRQLLESEEFAAIVTELDTIDRLRTPIFRRRATNTLEAIMLQQPTGPTHAETVRKAAALYLRSTAHIEPRPTQPEYESTPEPEHHPAQSSQTHRAPPPDHTATADAQANTIRNAAGQPTAHHPPPSRRQSA